MSVSFVSKVETSSRLSTFSWFKSFSICSSVSEENIKHYFLLPRLESFFPIRRLEKNGNWNSKYSFKEKKKQPSVKYMNNLKVSFVWIKLIYGDAGGLEGGDNWDTGGGSLKKE